MILSEFVIAIVELVDAQYEEMRFSFYRTMQSVALMMLGYATALVGIIFILLGAQMALEYYAGEIFSYFITAFIAFFVTAFIFYWSARKSVRRRVH